jgi:hypothetical protein
VAKIVVHWKTIFSRSVGLSFKLDPVRKSFDFNPLETFVPAGLACAQKGDRGVSPAM